jgi:hypothetical protein
MGTARTRTRAAASSPAGAKMQCCWVARAGGEFRPQRAWAGAVLGVWARSALEKTVTIRRGIPGSPGRRHSSSHRRHFMPGPVDPTVATLDYVALRRWYPPRHCGSTLYPWLAGNKPELPGPLATEVPWRLRSEPERRPGARHNGTAEPSYQACANLQSARPYGFTIQTTSPISLRRQDLSAVRYQCGAQIATAIRKTGA